MGVDLEYHSADAGMSGRGPRAGTAPKPENFKGRPVPQTVRRSGRLEVRKGHLGPLPLPGMKVMPHWHPDTTRTVLVMSGTLYFAVGKQWDESKLKAYPAGTLYSEPARSPHYAWAKDGEVILQVTAIGPTGNVPIPQKQ
jgi:hypothetical protein